MDISKHIPESQVLVKARATDKWDIMGQLLDAVVRNPEFQSRCKLSREEVWEAIVEREQKMSTGLGSGFALPHARLPDFEGLAVALAFMAEDLEFDSLDGKPVRTVCLVLAPRREPTMALKMSSAITSLLANPDTQSLLSHAETAADVCALLQDSGISLEVVVTARDIMRPALFRVGPDTPLPEVTHMMMRHREEATAVVDAEDRIVGEITCDILFQFGIPDFFTTLKSVSFISRFDPFEKYFDKEAKSVARDVMHTSPPAMPEDSTLLEIVFALSVQKHPKVYVTRDGRLMGVVDRSTVLDRVVNF